MKNSQILTAIFAASCLLQTIAWGHDSKVIASASALLGKLPKTFPKPLVPQDNKLTKEKIDLGRYLFYDVRLSANANISCGTCHLQSMAFTDGMAFSTGTSGDKTARSAQPLANVAWNTTLTWANPALVNLERQMLVPLFGDNPVEMGVNDHNKTQILARISNDKLYAAKFKAAFPSENAPINFKNIIKAIASFERVLVSANSRYDKYLRNEIVLSESEMRGKDLFFGEKAECFHCHGSFNFNDQANFQENKTPETPFHNTGLYNLDEKGSYPASAMGIIEITGKADDMGKFRAASLRNVALTAPYMHDGSIRTLKEVVATYAAGGRNIQTGANIGDGRRNPHKSELIGNIDLNEQEQSDIVSFLEALTDQDFVSNTEFSNPFIAKK